MQKIEYRIKAVTRFVVTRYAGGDVPEEAAPLGSQPKGEFDNPDVAYEVAYALCKAEHDRLGWPVGDERIQYPKPLMRADLNLHQALGLSPIPDYKGYIEAE